MKRIRLILVDDEKRVRTTIKSVLELHYPNAIVIGEAENILSAKELIHSLQPDLVLLDIKMPGGTGFDLLKQVWPCPFKVIFITAFDQYAIQAFKYSAVDYLLKPIIPEDLVLALDKSAEQLNRNNETLKLENLLDNFSQLTKDAKKIVLNTQDKIHIVGINEIIRCESDANYTTFSLLNKKPVVMSKPLKEYDEMLSPFGFFRCHHSHLVNLSMIDRLEKREGGVLIMKDHSEAMVSSRKYSELLAAIGNL
jgi:two-component system, LytTR family, response regulator